jgi:hypothetical protein
MLNTGQDQEAKLEDLSESEDIAPNMYEHDAAPHFNDSVIIKGWCRLEHIYTSIVSEIH